MKSDLSRVKPGDTIFTIQDEYTVVEKKEDINVHLDHIKTAELKFNVKIKP
jgi:hypothetical protein